MLIMDEIIKALEICETRLDPEVLKTVLDARNRVSPWVIEELDEDEVFVFGSDEMGIHDGRASLKAVDEYGAQQGFGEGLSGKSYAIPTTKVNPKYEEDAKKYLDELKNAKTREEREQILNDHKDDYKDRKGDDAFKLVRDLEMEIMPSVKKFITTARKNPNKKFLVTRIGGGFAGFFDADMAPLFKDALKLKNVYLPKSFLDELFGVSLNINCPSHLVPSKCEGDEDFPKALERQLALYSRWVRKNLFHERKDLKVIDAMETMCNCVMKAVDMYYRGLPANAYNSVKDGLDNLIGADGYCSFSELKGERFYRMRVESDNWAKRTVDKNGMFHIPFTLRGIVKTQRYSVPGFPCLYLGKHVEGCWEELGRPTLSNCLISRFEQKEGVSIKVLDMRIPDEDEWFVGKGRDVKKPLSKIRNMVVLFPLIIACTFKTKSQNATFKPEYIVPQLLLQYVKEYGYIQNRLVKKDEREIYGVMYTSVQKPTRELADVVQDNTYDNVVLPVIDIKESYCSRLRDIFEWTDPYCVEFVSVSNNTASMRSGSRFEEIENQIDLLNTDEE